ncbi:MAG: DUF6812 domain-containing protein [Dehalogenimonas sp.]
MNNSEPSKPNIEACAAGIGRFRKIKILVYTTNGIFAGTTLCQPQQRLLDALNKGFHSPSMQTLVDFISLSEVILFNSPEEPRNMETAYIRKNNILFVGEQSPTSGPTQPNVYPTRHKKQLQAVINLPQLSLTGNMHSEMWEELQEALNRSDQFIPVTDVDFNPPLPTGIERLNFVAVNKDHIVYVGK